MAAIETTRTAPFGAIASLRFVEFFEGAARAIKTRIVAERTYNELSKLSAAQLRDIGLADQDLGTFCRDAAARAR